MEHSGESAGRREKPVSCGCDLFYDQADALEQLIRKSVREELKCGDMRQTVATAEPEELPDQVLDFISMLQEE